MESKERKINGKMILKIIAIVLASIILLVALVLCGAIGYFKLSVASYYSASEKEFVIPDINDGFVPQGMYYNEGKEHFLVTGYSVDGEASPVYIVDNDGKSKTVLLAKADGSAFKGHSGGIAAYGDNVYVAGGDDRCLYVYSYEELLNAQDGASINCKGSFSTRAGEGDHVDVSCVSIFNGRIIVGEFYREANYPTLDSHKLTTGCGDYNQALAVAFELSDESEFGIVSEPICAYSMPDQVQGMCFTDEKIYLSTSYGVAFSHILEYDAERVKESKITVLGAEVPLYELDSSSLAYDYKIAPMSEEIEMVNGRLYVMCESASDKYIFGNLTGARWCYSTSLEDMKK